METKLPGILDDAVALDSSSIDHHTIGAPSGASDEHRHVAMTLARAIGSGARNRGVVVYATPPTLRAIALALPEVVVNCHFGVWIYDVASEHENTARRRIND